METEDKDALYRVAYDEAVRALLHQQTLVESFRGRAGLLLSTAAVVTSFFGAQGLGRSGSGVFAWLALASFALLAISCLAVLWPRRWEFAASPDIVIRDYVDAGGPASIGELHRDLSLHMRGSRLVNEQGMARLVVFLQIASSALAIEVLLWSIAIGSAA